MLSHYNEVLITTNIHCTSFGDVCFQKTAETLPLTNNSTKAIWKVTSDKLLTKQALRKKLYTKNTYIIKLFFKVVTTRTEEFVILGNKFLYAYVKAHCFLTPSTNSLLLKRCETNQLLR
jgi:hypothetical protein